MTVEGAMKRGADAAHRALTGSKGAMPSDAVETRREWLSEILGGKR